MLKVLHTGDWHIGSFPGPEVGGQNARFQDICRCLDFQAMYAEEHRPDLIVVSGDIFHQARVWSDRGLRESRTAIDHIRRLSNVAPTVVLRGTPNHDSEEQFEMLTTAFYGDDSVSVVTEPEVLHIHTYHGQRVDVACIPGFDRGVHRAAHPGLSREEETQVFTDELAKVVLGLKAQCEPGVTSILSTHFTVPGCNMESGQTALFAQFEPVIYPDTLKAADFDLVALGHIHRPQQLPEAGRAVFYCGSITGLNFNDENQPRGFYIHDIDDDGETWSEYVETPYPFAGRRRCNGYRDADRTFHVTAYEGEPGYTTNDPAKLVYVETPEFYYFDGIDGDYEVMAVSTYPVPGFEFMPRTYSAAYLVAMEGETDSKKPTSRSGVFSDYNSLNGWATDIKKLGSQYTGMLAVDNYIDGLLMMVEFCTKDVQTVIMGASTLPYSDSHVALAAEDSANRILITKAQAAGYVVGQTISLSKSNIWSDEVAKNRIVTKIEDKSTDQTYLYFDGAAVSIAEGCHVSSRPWVNGAADVVVASSGSTVDNTSGKYPFIYRGKENPYANAWVNVADLLHVREGTEDNYKYHMAYLPDPTKYAGGTVSSDYVQLDFEMPGQDGYVKELGKDPRYPFIRVTKTVGGSSSTYYADYYWYGRNAVNAVVAGGNLSDGRYCGPRSFYCNNAPSDSGWYRRARLS